MVTREQAIKSKSRGEGVVAMQCDTFSPSNVDLLHWRLSCAAETDRINKSAASLTAQNYRLALRGARRDSDAHFTLLQVRFLA
jgi:hypothetical protein